MPPSSLRVVAIALSALWLGGLLTLDLAVTPVVLGAAPTRSAGLAAIGGVVVRFGPLALGTGLGLAACAVAHAALRRPAGPLRWTGPSGALLAAGMAGVAVLAVNPRIERLLAVGPDHWERGQAVTLAGLLQGTAYVFAAQALGLLVALVSLALGAERARRPRPGEL